MWVFNPDDYIKRVLSPAADDFKNEGRIPDIFLRYDLPLDVSNEKDIETAISTVVASWNKSKQNPRFKQLLPVLLAPREQQEARRILLDPAARSEQRAVIEADRKKRLEARFKSLNESISVIAAKGFITPSEQKALVARFIAEGLPEADILSHLRVPVREAATRLPSDEGLPKAVRDQIRSNLAVLGKRHLYDFLGITPGSAKELISKSYRERESEWRPKPSDFRKSAAQDLLGVIKTYLVNGDAAKYETARVWDVVDKLRPEVYLAATDKLVTCNEFEKLLGLAVSLGLEKSIAADYIIALAQEKNAAVEWSFGEETVRCANCFTEVPRNKNTERCTVCGFDLWAHCPRCETGVPASDSACGKCGFTIGNLPYVRLLLRKVRLALDDARIGDAMNSAREAEDLWGRHGDVDNLLNEIEARVREIECIRQKLNEAISSRSLFAAYQILKSLAVAAPEYEWRDGKTTEQLTGDVNEQLEQVKLFLEKGREHEHGKQFNEAVLAYQYALALAADAEEARKGLRRHPPEPPFNVQASIHEGHVLIDWSASPAVGDIEYLVMRRENRAPTSPDDGQMVARTAAASCRDEQARPASFVFYSVFAERSGVTSQAVSTSGALVTHEVTQLFLEVGDAVVRGSWQLNVTEGRVRVFCKEGGPPVSFEQCREVSLAGTHDFVDRSVHNGHLYYYRVLVEYHDPSGRLVRTKGLVESARPQQPPAAVEGLLIDVEDKALRVSWKPPSHGAVNIYRAYSEPDWKPGSQISPSRLPSLGVMIKNVADGLAIDHDPSDRPVVYIPVTVAGDVLIIGRGRRYIATEDVSKLKAQDFGHYLLLQWQWPKDSGLALVTWRADTHPQDAQDPRAFKRKITRGEYENRGGFRINSPASTPYYFVVFAITEFDGQHLYSSGMTSEAQAELRKSEPINISYTISRGRFRRNRATITLSAEKTIECLPNIVVVAKRGDLQPLRIEDGTILARFGGISIPASIPVPNQFNLDGVRRPSYLRAFFQEPSSYTSFKLLDPPPNQLKLR